MEYQEKFLDGVGYVFTATARNSPSGGDGTVMRNSALGSGASKTFIVRLKDCNDAVGITSNVKHADFLELPMVEDLVRKLLLDLLADGTTPHVCIDPPPPGQSEPPIIAHGVDSLRVYIASPAEVHAVDSANRHTGPIASPVADSDAQFMEQKIPNSTFRFPHELWLDTTKGPYSIAVLGRGSGTFSLIVERYIDDDRQSKIVYPNVLVNPQTLS